MSLLPRPSTFTSSAHTSSSSAPPTNQSQSQTAQHQLATISPNPLPPNTYGSTRLLEKQHEWQGVALLRQASEGMLNQVEALAKEGDVMADGGKAIGSVLANWPNVFRIISLCSTPSSAQANATTESGDPEEQEEEEEEPKVLPRLVRLQVDGLAESEGS